MASDEGRELMLSVSTTSAGDHCWRTAAVSPAQVQDAQGGSPRSVPRKVVGQWLISTSVPKIEITRTLRVRVHRVPVIRVEISNAYQIAKRFKVHTDRPELLQVLPPSNQAKADPSEHSKHVAVGNPRVWHEVSVGARSKQSVPWAVTVNTAGALAAGPASGSSGGADTGDDSRTEERTERAILFVTDEDDKIEETIELWLEISSMPASVTSSPARSPVAGGCMPSLPPLTITTSADLTIDTRYDVIVNSVSPEFQSTGSDSGINFSVWKTLSGYNPSEDQEKPESIKYDQGQFIASNGAAPTYADVLWSKVPQDSDSPVQYIVHALAPDLSRRPKRLRTGLAKDEAFSALVAVYFRSMWKATIIGGRHCSIGMPPLGDGVFANDPEDVMSAAVLAHTAYRASGGSASVSIALWTPDGQPPPTMAKWQAAAAAAPVGNSQLLAALRAALGPAGQATLLSRLPPAHTTGELTELLKAAAMGGSKPAAPGGNDTGGEPHEKGQQAEQVALMAKDFLAARKDKAQQKKLKKQLGANQCYPFS